MIVDRVLRPVRSQSEPSASRAARDDNLHPLQRPDALHLGHGGCRRRCLPRVCLALLLVPLDPVLELLDAVLLIPRHLRVQALLRLELLELAAKASDIRLLQGIIASLLTRSLILGELFLLLRPTVGIAGG